MATWEEIQNEIAGMLADGQPLEDVLAKLEERKNEIAKANLLKAMDDMKKGQMTNEEWLNSLKLDTKAYWLANTCRKAMWEDKYDNNDEKSTLDYWVEWLKQPHTTEE